MGKSKDTRRLSDNQAMAQNNSIRSSSRKLNLVAQTIRGLSAEKAVAELSFSKKRIAKVALEVLKSAIANAVNNEGADATGLYIKEARVDAGPVMKRHFFDSRSHIGHKNHRTSHINIVVATRN